MSATPETSEFVWLDESLLPRAEARIDPLDLGFLQGLGVFETLWAAPNQDSWQVKRHHRRLKSGCERLELSLPSLDQLIEASRLVREANGLSGVAARIRWTLTRRNWDGQRLLVSVSTASAPSGPARVMVAPQRRHRLDPLSGIKASSYGGLALLAHRAHAAGFDEALYANEEAELVEGASSNIFLLRGKELWTPSLSSGCLPGVSRELVLELASAGTGEFRICQAPILLAGLESFEAAFLTNSQLGIRRIAEIEGREMSEFGEGLHELKAALDADRLGQ